MYMILPLVVSSGLLSGFVTADFTRSVIVPSLGFDRCASGLFLLSFLITMKVIICQARLGTN